MTCYTGGCGLGGWGGPLPGDPSNDVVLSAVSAYGGIDVSWSYPTTNPYAVAYVKVYRSLTNDQTAAVKIAEVGGDRFFDAHETVTTCYYWIQLISSNGTELALVGPATATSRLTIEKLLEQLSGQIDDSLLASLLRTKVDKIPLLELNLAAEISNRLADNTSLAAVLGALEADVNGVAAAIVSETTARITANSALVSSLDAVAVQVSGNTAAILTEATVRADAISAMASRVTILEAFVGGAGDGSGFMAALIAEQTARVDADTAIVTDMTALIATNRSETDANLTAAIATESSARVTADTALATSVSALETSLTSLIGTEIAAAIVSERTVRVTAEGALSTRIDTTQASITSLDSTLTALISEETIARTSADTSLAGSITTAQTTLAGQIASARTDLTAEISIVDGKATAIGARWTAIVDVNGMVGGFGVYNNGSTIQAGFDVDLFWVGRATDKIKPFIIDAGTVYIKEAVIPTLTASKIDTRGLLIRNAAGQVIFGAGATVDPSVYMSVPTTWLNDNVAVGGANLLGMSAFEKWDSINSRPVGWTTYANGSTPIVLSQSAGALGRFGTHFVRVTTTPPQIAGTFFGVYTNASIDGGTGAVQQWISGQTYVVSFWAKAANADMLGKGLYAAVRNDNFASYEVIAAPPLTLNFQQYVLRVVAGIGNTEVNQELFITTDGASAIAAGAAWDLSAPKVSLGRTVTSWVACERDNRNTLLIPSISTAQLTADGAQTAANNAQTTANTANTAASNAQTTANSAITFLAGKLNSSSASTLSATVSVDAISGAGFRAGNLTWDSAGARISGYGVAMTPGGLAAYNPAGAQTFVLDAYTGSLALKGDISGSTLNAVGGLSVNGRTWPSGDGVWLGMDSGYAKLVIGNATQYLSYSAQTGKLVLALDTMTVSAAPVSISSYAYGSGDYAHGTTMASVSGGTGPYSYAWAITNINQDPSGSTGTAFITGTSGTYGQTCGLATRGQSDNSIVFAHLRCTVTDANGRSAFVTVPLSVTRGTPA